MSDPILANQRLNQKHWSDLRVDASPFRSAFEYAAIGMVLADTDGRCLAANRTFCEMVGYTEDELLKLELARLTHPDDLPENLRLSRQLIDGQIDSFKYEQRYLHRQGRVVWTLLSASLVRDDYGHPLYLISQIQDITERKQAEAAEREQRELAEALRDAAQALSSTRNLDELLDRILYSARRIVPHDVGAILLIDDRGDAYMARLRDDTGRASKGVVSAVRFSVAETANLHVMAEFRRPLVIPDIDHYPGWIHLENTPVARSYVGAPICIEDQVIGFISLRKVNSHFFTREHAERLQALAQQAAIAIENARSFEAERRQSDMAEALRETAAALNSTLNLDEVLDRILISAAQVVPYDAINIMLLDEAGAAAVARSHGYEEFGIAEWVRALKLNVQEMPGLLHIARTHQPCHVPDVAVDPSWVSFSETRWQRSYIGAPIRLKGKVVGFLNFDSATPGFFSIEQARRAQVFADQVALAMQNAQSYAAIQRHVHRLTALHQASVAVALAQTAPRCTSRSCAPPGNWSPPMRAACCCLTSGNPSSSRPSRGCRSPCWAAPLRSEAGSTAARLSCASCSIFTMTLSSTIGCRHQPVSGAAAVPLIWQDRLVGTLCAINQQPRQYDEDDLHVLDLFAALAAASLEQRRATAEAQAREAYLLKSDPHQLLLTALRAVQAGETFITTWKCIAATSWTNRASRTRPA